MIFLAVAVLTVFGTASRVEGKDPKDQEFRHVIVTLNNGKTVDGYIKSGWHAETAYVKLKRENFSFTLVPTPDSKEKTKYTAEEVRSIEYVEKTEASPDGIRWESHPVASPNLKDRHNTNRLFVCCSDANGNAALYWWKHWEVTTNKAGQTRKLVTVYGIRFQEDTIVYPYYLVNSVLMKDKKPGLKEFYKTWFKGPEGKVHKKEAKEDDAWMLNMYDAYLESRKNVSGSGK